VRPAVEVHHHRDFIPRLVRQLDTMHSSAVNTPHPNRSAHIQTHHVTELRL